ncbi:uncharacterized protein EI97DRAFT_500836 [Westerdykella ornata]|uniref:Anaphase-promoting complex subunit 4 n=1 Tax=Westerdykella ornata TaxID=318751 RepID=A0A6A6JLX1_WESOR|nr:uncharacterized protein EI97DRAFT_500836 [Westerdykella ornata]KAF2277244.1 hypothetical protein EI97DRAFT_500836 [Westerdykella ornata]
MESIKGPKLLKQAEKVLLRPIHPHLLSYCPTMDLIAVVTDEENLDVYRINGQRAFGLKRKKKNVTVDSICWEFNGQALAVAWSDGLTDILSAETGKVIHPNVPAPPVGEEAPRIRCIGWGLNFINVESVKRRTGLRQQKGDPKGRPTVTFAAETTDDWDTHRDDTTIEDFLQRQPDLQKLDIDPDLPDQLAMMDMEALLPRLPAIPLPPANPFMRAGAQADAGGFSSQAQVDSLLHSQHLKDHNSVDMLIRCTDSGTVHPSIYDSLETINIQLPSSWSLKSSKALLHASHPYSNSHVLLTEIVTDTSDTRLAFVPLTLGFIPSAGIYLHIISSKASQLQNLLLYIQQTLSRIQTWWQHSMDLPSKFMRNISETLQGKGQGTLVENFYHSVCTGHWYPVVREWLLDELGEAGWKRWDTTVKSSLTTVIQLLQENFLPALDRCSIILSRLRGLARYHDTDSSGDVVGSESSSDGGWIFNTPVRDFTSLLEQIQNLRFLGHTAMKYATEEKRGWYYMSRWLRYAIEIEGMEPGSQTRMEWDNKDPAIDVEMVLEYIQFSLQRSDLEPLLKGAGTLDEEVQKRGMTGYEETVKAVEGIRQGAGFGAQSVCMEFVLGGVKEGCKALLGGISKWQRSNVSMDCGIVLEDVGDDGNEGAVMDMRMVFELANDPANTARSSAATTAQSIRNLTNGLSSLTLSKPTHSPSSQTDSSEPPDAITTYILHHQPSSSTTSNQPHPPRPQLHIHRLAHSPSITSLPASVHTYAISTLEFPTEPTVSCRILDAKFADDVALLVLLELSKEDKKKYLILSLPYTPTTAALQAPGQKPQVIHYSPQLCNPSNNHSSGDDALRQHVLPHGTPLPPSSPCRTTIAVSWEDIQAHTRHVFSPGGGNDGGEQAEAEAEAEAEAGRERGGGVEDDSFVPMKMEVNGRQGRRVVLVLAEGGRGWRVLDLDFLEGEAEVGEKKGVGR